MACAQRYLNKVVIVTGGSKGIGRGIVQVFGKNLCIVFCAIRQMGVNRTTEYSFHVCFAVQNGAKVVFCARGGEILSFTCLFETLCNET